MTASRRRTLGTLISVAILAAVVLPLLPSHSAQAFNLTNGIVGNLAKDCRENGNCTWCDFVGLMVVLQKVILSLFGGLALIMLVWGGQSIIRAAGNQERVSKGKGIITATLVGVAIVLGGYFIVNVVVGILITPQGQPLSKKLFGSSWWEAQCTVAPTNPEFCRGKADGTPCGDTGEDLVCFDETCGQRACSSLTSDPTHPYTCLPDCTPTTTYTEKAGYCTNNLKCCYTN